MEQREINTADEATDFAIEWQQRFGEAPKSWEELVASQQFFEALVVRFPELADEFRENGII